MSGATPVCTQPGKADLPWRCAVRPHAEQPATLQETSCASSAQRCPKARAHGLVPMSARMRRPKQAAPMFRHLKPRPLSRMQSAQHQPILQRWPRRLQQLLRFHQNQTRQGVMRYPGSALQVQCIVTVGCPPPVQSPAELTMDGSQSPKTCKGGCEGGCGGPARCQIF